jgi:NAD(P)-dependent dehydrogenase (short-subunit alcohol dehydrogenase family)
MMMTNKTVLLTGASSGIGAATAQYFWQKGWNVAATMRDPQKANLGIDDSRVIYPSLDVTNPDTISSAIAETLAQFGCIDVLVNNAGYALMGPIEGANREQLDRQFETNFFGVVNMMQAVLPIMRQQGNGTIINVTSIGGRIGFPMTAAYHGTKWAVEGVSEAMYYELKPLGIRIKIIEPGGTKTNFINHGATWTTHDHYLETIDRVQRFMKKINDSLPGSEGVAKSIYRAATDGSPRLRYSPHGKILLALHALLPDRLWRSFVETIMLSK